MHIYEYIYAHTYTCMKMQVDVMYFLLGLEQS